MCRSRARSMDFARLKTSCAASRPNGISTARWSGSNRRIRLPLCTLTICPARRPETHPMIVKRFFEPQLAQNSYLIGCGTAKEALVIDPHRDVDVYIRAATADDLHITQVTETHIHADYLSGSRELAR